MTVMAFMLTVATEKERKESEFVRLNSKGDPYYGNIKLLSSDDRVQFVPEEAVRRLSDGLNVVEVSEGDVQSLVLHMLICAGEEDLYSDVTSVGGYSVEAVNFGTFNIAFLNSRQEAGIVMQADIANPNGDLTVTMAGHEFILTEGDMYEGVNVYSVVSALITEKYCSLPNVRYSVDDMFFMYRRTASVKPILLTYGDIKGRKDVASEWRPDGEEKVRVRIDYDEYTRLNKVLPME